MGARASVHALAGIAAAAALVGLAGAVLLVVGASDRAVPAVVAPAAGEVVGIDYTMDEDDGTLVSRVAVELDGELDRRSDVRIRLQPAGSWYRCTVEPVGAAHVPDRWRLGCTTEGPMTAVPAIDEVKLMVTTVDGW